MPADSGGIGGRWHATRTSFAVVPEIIVSAGSREDQDHAATRRLLAF